MGASYDLEASYDRRPFGCDLCCRYSVSSFSLMLRSPGMERKSILFLVGFFCFLNAEKLLFRDEHQWLEEEERRQGEEAPSFPFQDPTLPWDQRLDDLVSRLSLDEIVPQTLAVYGGHTPAIPRLNINPYVWITECLHGDVGTHGTSFPQSIGLAASFRYCHSFVP